MADGPLLDTCRRWLAGFDALVAEHRDELTRLDSAIGDADHGTNLARGMRAVVERLDASPPADAAQLCKETAMALINSVGGASGPLYGTFFLRLSTALAGQDDAAALAAGLRAGAEGVRARGKSDPGDKTMLDAMLPAVAAFEKATFDKAAFDKAADLPAAAEAAAAAAADGRDATEPMQARKGRASYLGERSIGHIDPGAASTALLFRALADATR